MKRKKNSRVRLWKGGKNGVGGKERKEERPRLFREAGEKIGFASATGSHPSPLLLCFFRSSHAFELSQPEKSFIST